MNYEQEIEEDLENMIEVAKDLALVYHTTKRELKEFIESSFRTNIPGEYAIMSNKIISELVEIFVYDFELTEDQIKRFKQQILSVWDDRKNFEEFMENDKSTKYYQYLPIIHELKSEAEMAADTYDSKLCSLDEFLDKTFTCNCGKCDPNGKSEKMLKEIYCVFARKHIEDPDGDMEDKEVERLIDLYIEGQSIYFVKKLTNNINTN